MKPPNDFPVKLEHLLLKIGVNEVKNYIVPVKCPDIPVIVII